MAVNAQVLQNAQNGAVWAGKVGNTTYFARKINGKYEVWNSGDSTHYTVSLNQAVQFINQHNGKNANQTAKDLPNKPAEKKKPAAKTKKKQASGAADDDSGKGKKPAFVLRTEPDPDLKKGRRVENPLGWLPSYTYQLSLYMMTPDAYEAFVASGRTQINAQNPNGGFDAYDIVEGPASGGGGAWLIAQSGGRANEFKAPSFPFDYGIDNLKIVIAGPKDTGAATGASSVNFTVTEPYGFSFISNMRRAGDANKAYTEQWKYQKKQAAAAKQKQKGGKKKGGKSTGPNNPMRSFFVIGIRFFGWDDHGNPVTGNWVPPGASGPIDPNANGYALFETFYDVKVTKVQSKIDGKATVYNFTAVGQAEQSGLNKSKGMIKNEVKITGGTVDEAINKLLNALNEESKKLNKDGAYSEYTVAYADSEAEASIGQATLVSKAELDKYKWPGSGAKSTVQSNDKTAVQNQKPKNNKKEFTIPRGTPVLQALSQIIMHSSFLEDALEVVYNTSIEPNPEADGLEQIQPDTGKILKWYTCTPNIKNIEWDDSIADWVYDIEYILQTYETPAIDSAVANPKAGYYGPAKRYEYWYTGKNTEILSYQQTIDLLFSQAVLDADNKESGNKSETPLVKGQRNDEPKEGRAGLGNEAQNNFLTNIYNTGMAVATMQILGDPDLLCTPYAKVNGKEVANTQRAAGSETQIYDKFYSGVSGKKVNISGGQIFIEVDFKEAVDYKSELGYLSINDSIQFWKSNIPNNSKQAEARRNRIEGMSYEIVKVECLFRNGVFTQTLTLQMQNFEEPEKKKSAARPKKKKKTTGSPPKNKQVTTNNSGLKNDQPKTIAPFKDQATADYWRSPQVQAAARAVFAKGKGPVRDDDG